MRLFAVTAVLTFRLASAAAASPVVIFDDFEDGTTEGWFAGGGPVGSFPPVPPTNVADGGPLGSGDNYLQITSQGGAGAGGRLVAMNASTWALDYLGLDIASIEMDVINLGNNDVSLRLLFEDPIPGPPSNVTSTIAPVFLPAGSGWTHVVFSLDPGNLQALLGSAAAALSHTTVLRLFHDPVPGVDFPGPPIAAQIGVDNILAQALPVPEPASLLLVGVAGSAYAGRRLTRRRAQ
jgi:hypothetical protein